MANLSDHQPEPDLEGLVAAALACRESDGEAGLEAFLAEHAASADTVREALADLEIVDRMTGDGSAPPTAVPLQFGEFRVKAELGAGGMGVVYLAEQTSLGREVALKVVRPELLLFEGARERFLREIDAVARIEHPGIVPILASGMTRGVPWYAMPRLRGRSGEELLQRLRDRSAATLTGADLLEALRFDDSVYEAGEAVTAKFSGNYWRGVVRLVHEAALGIHHVHLRGIVHRDLKPSNIVFDATGRAVVLDFGLAQVRGSTKLTRTGSTAGSPAFMAPEQVRGEPADERTDVYGLAATLAALLLLRSPYSGRTEAELREQILTGARLDLSHHAEVPTELAIVVAAAMDVERSRRHESAAAFAADLDAVLHGRPILARRLPWPVRARRFVARHRVLSVAMAVALFSAGVLATVLLVQAERSRVELQGQVERADRSVTVSVDAVEALLFEVTVDRLRNQPEMQQLGLRLLRHAVTLFDELAIDEQHRRRVEWLRIRSWSQITVFESLFGNAAAAEAAARRLIELADARLAEHNELRLRIVRASACSEVAECCFKAGRRQEAEEFVAIARHDLEFCRDDEEHGENAVRELAMLETVLGSAARQAGDQATARAAFRRAVEIAAELDESEQPALMHHQSQMFLARSLRRNREFDEARTILADILADYPEVPDKRYESGWPIPRELRARALSERFLIEFYSKRYGRAIDLAPAAMAALGDVLDDYPDVANLRLERAAGAGNLALALIRHGKDYEAAEPWLRLAVADLERLVAGAGSPQAAHFLVQQYKSLAYVLRQLGRWDELLVTARALAAREGNPENLRRAGSEIVHCARAFADARSPALYDEALRLLIGARRAGLEFRIDRPHYAPLHELPGWAELAKD
ncbi:MAG: serine/threonine protein kinase [bacterium]|nr:serine/threonine protein kinase [bacterium]